MYSIILLKNPPILTIFTSSDRYPWFVLYNNLRIDNLFINVSVWFLKKCLLASELKIKGLRIPMRFINMFTLFVENKIFLCLLGMCIIVLLVVSF